MSKEPATRKRQPAKRSSREGERELREIAEYYDSQTEDEELVEWEAAWAERDRAAR